MEAILNTSIDRGRSFVYSDLGANDSHAAGEVIVVGTALVGICLEKAAGATVRAASIAANTIPSPDRCALMYEHEDVTILKNTALVISAGDLVFWDVADNNVNKTASGNYAVGVALEDAASAGTTVRIAFDGCHQHLADITGEAATFFGATDITGAEAETLTDTSNADALHVHDTAGLTADCIDGTLIADDAVGEEHIEEQVIQIAEVTISAAELVAGTSIKDLVAAPAAGKAIEFISAVLIYDYATAAYTAGGNLTINLKAGAALTGLVSAANSFGAAEDKIVQFVPLAAAAQPLALITAISLVTSVQFTNPGTAAGVARVKVAYRVITTALA